MLSTKKRTSWPSSSRKYSAAVRPVRVTRERAPGGSVIWPYESAAIRQKSSFPDTDRFLRVRSPTPQNTEYHHDVEQYCYHLHHDNSLTNQHHQTDPFYHPMGTVQKVNYLIPVSSTRTSVSCSVNKGPLMNGHGFFIAYRTKSINGTTKHS